MERSSILLKGNEGVFELRMVSVYVCPTAMSDVIDLCSAATSGRVGGSCLETRAVNLCPWADRPGKVPSLDGKRWGSAPSSQS